MWSFSYDGSKDKTTDYKLPLLRQCTTALWTTQRNASTPGEFPRTQRVERLEKTINQVMLLGRVGANPEKRGTEEHPVVTFSLATHTNYRKQDDLIQQTDWHRIAVFKPYLRDVVYQYMSKGQRVMVQGRLGYLERKDPNDDSIIKTATIVADEVIFFNKSGQVEDMQAI